MTKSSRCTARLATVAPAVGMGVAVSTVPAQAVPIATAPGPGGRSVVEFGADAA